MRKRRNDIPELELTVEKVVKPGTVIKSYMSDKISSRELATEDYNAKDWGRWLKFSTNRYITPDLPEDFSIEDFVEHEENRSGATFPLKIFNGTGYIYLEYSPYLRSEHELLFKGNLYINEEKIKNGLDKIRPIPKDYLITYQQVDLMEYINYSDFENDLPEVAYIKIPENPEITEVSQAFKACKIITDMVYSYSEQNLDSWPKQEHQKEKSQSEDNKKSTELQLLSEN